jgi:hypothetical protein
MRKISVWCFHNLRVVVKRVLNPATPSGDNTCAVLVRVATDVNGWYIPV